MSVPIVTLTKLPLGGWMTTMVPVMGQEVRALDVVWTDQGPHLITISENASLLESVEVAVLGIAFDKIGSDYRAGLPYGRWRYLCTEVNHVQNSLHVFFVKLSEESGLTT